MNRIILFFALIFSTVYCFSQEIIAQWDFKDVTINKEIADSKSNFSLTQCVFSSDEFTHGVASSYWKSFDNWENSWSLEGFFKTNDAASTIMCIAGTRSLLSGYSGWDLTMLKNGVLRFLVSNSKGEQAVLLSSRSFDDNKKHHFKILWDAKSHNMQLILDNKFNYQKDCDVIMDSRTNRFFYLGAQPKSSGSVGVYFKGKLWDFVYCGKLVEITKSALTLDKIDSALTGAKKVDAMTMWIDAQDLAIEGMSNTDGIEMYTRLADKYKDEVRDKVWALSRHSSGIVVHFTVEGTNFISAKWNLKSNAFMPHMTPMGINGLDLYVKHNGKWVWAGVGRPNRLEKQQEAVLKNGFPKDKKYECMIYLPLYTGISDLKLGFTQGAKVDPFKSDKKVMVFYGSSLTQGCSASRPGMSYPAMLGRYFDMPFINLGFSGNGKMDKIFVDILSEIDASIYVIDCLGNMLESEFSQQEIINRALYLVRNLHARKPNVPIILAEDRYPAYPNLSDKPIIHERRIAQKKAFEILKKEILNIYYIPGDKLMGDDNEATVDGSHPTDLGLYRHFLIYKEVIKNIFNRK